MQKCSMRGKTQRLHLEVGNMGGSLERKMHSRLVGKQVEHVEGSRERAMQR